MITAWDGPYGAMLIAASDRGITYIDWVNSRYSTGVTGNGGCEFITEAVEQLKQYAAGRRVSFDVPLDPSGTPFQQTVLDELQRIPFGEVITYGELAVKSKLLEHEGLVV